MCPIKLVREAERCLVTPLERICLLILRHLLIFITHSVKGNELHFSFTQQGIYYMLHPTDRIMHTTASDIPFIEEVVGMVKLK